MKAFAYLTHPLNIEQLKCDWPLARFLPDFAIRFLLRILPSYKLTKIKKIKSSKGNAISGYIITLPILSEKIKQADEQFTLNKIAQATEIANRLNAGILGLGGEFSRRSYPLKNNFKIPVTNGSHFTVWSIIEAIYRLSKIKKVNLRDSTVSIIGATGITGTLCAKKLSYFVSKLIIADGDENKLKSLKEKIEVLNKINIEINSGISTAAEDADFVIVICENTADQLNLDLFKRGAIVCDATLGNSFSEKLKNRKDLSVIKCGLAKISAENKIVSTSLAETMLLAFEEKFVSYSLNGNINLDKLEEIADIATRQGLEIWVPEAPVI